MEKKLPKDFFWGGSVSSFQTEGAWDEGGKGLSIYDVRPTPEGHADWKVAIDEYHRYKEDIQLMKEMGFNFYRFSICWSRIIPNGDDEINEEGVQFYNNLIDELIANGITPMITLVHFDMPYHLVKEYNGLHHVRLLIYLNVMQEFVWNVLVIELNTGCHLMNRTYIHVT